MKRKKAKIYVRRKEALKDEKEKRKGIKNMEEMRLL